MMATLEAPWYDALYSKKGRAQLPLEASPWRQLYEAAAALVPLCPPVVDLGCGTGRFAQELAIRGVHSYRGLDFSAAAVEEARAYVRHPRFRFEHGDLRTMDLARLRGCTVVCLEVLEHLADDLGLLRRLPRGTLVIASVPSYDSEAHVRYFPCEGDAVARYGEAFTSLRRWRVAGADGRFFHLMQGRT